MLLPPIIGMLKLSGENVNSSADGFHHFLDKFLGRVYHCVHAALQIYSVVLATLYLREICITCSQYLCSDIK